jgi:hypothetical protein
MFSITAYFIGGCGDVLRDTPFRLGPEGNCLPGEDVMAVKVSTSNVGSVSCPCASQSLVDLG